MFYSLQLVVSDQIQKKDKSACQFMKMLNSVLSVQNQKNSRKKRPVNVLLTSVSGFRSKSENREKCLSIFLEIAKFSREKP